MTTKTPRRQAQMSSRLAALVAGLWLIAGVGELVLGITAGSVWYVVIGSGFLACCLLWSLNAVIWRRRAADRAGAEPEAHHPAS
jgi:hypothetical protein